MRNKDTDICVISITDIDYDIEDGEENDLPDTLTLKIPFSKLLEKGIAGRDLKENTQIDRTKLSEMVGDFITEETEYCHTGFCFDYSFLPVNKVGK